MTSLNFFRQCGNDKTFKDQVDAARGAKIRAIVFLLACFAGAIATGCDLFFRTTV